ncbi:proline-rich receptor-like protein kinase PERK1 [Forsythia ovata]|uniref:Proline-rich receptor-like protein kinase PERK1 n=1 Tax=Forsythia ovata TaxID=205694 RepID=A0ABD1XAC8_9LAMI
MATKLHKLLCILLFLSTILKYLAPTSSQECPYPCNTPLTGARNSLSVATTPSSPVSISPPAGAGYLPHSRPPPYFVNGLVPPPPEPIVPWFPFFYREAPQQNHSSSTALQGSRIMIIIFPLLITCVTSR